MTEAEWLACDDPQRMLAFVMEKVSGRKLRLFACACCRDVWEVLSRRGRIAVRVVERFADGNADDWDLRGARGGLEVEADRATEAGRETTPAHRAADYATGEDLAYWVPRAASEAAKAARAGAGPRQAALLRDVIGSPYSSPSISRAWLTADVRRLARKLYGGSRSPSGGLNGETLAVLSDALEEAGCTDEALLSHLRSPGPHVRGCWALDLILGKG